MKIKKEMEKSNKYKMKDVGKGEENTRMSYD